MSTTISYVQAIVAGQVAGVVVAPRPGVGRSGRERASRCQYPLLAAMILFTVGGLAPLLEPER